MQRKTVIAALLLLVVHSTSAQTAVPGSYRIDPAVSHIHWRIYRAGLLGGLGHNHVISAHNIRGSVEVATPLRQSEFQLEIPVAALELDNPELRSRYGKAFAGAISTEDIAATRENMLGRFGAECGGFPADSGAGQPAVRQRGYANTDNDSASRAQRIHNGSRAPALQRRQRNGERRLLPDPPATRVDPIQRLCQGPSRRGADRLFIPCDRKPILRRTVLH